MLLQTMLCARRSAAVRSCVPVPSAMAMLCSSTQGPSLRRFGYLLHAPRGLLQRLHNTTTPTTLADITASSDVLGNQKGLDDVSMFERWDADEKDFFMTNDQQLPSDSQAMDGVLEDDTLLNATHRAEVVDEPLEDPLPTRTTEGDAGSNKDEMEDVGNLDTVMERDLYDGLRGSPAAAGDIQTPEDVDDALDDELADVAAPSSSAAMFTRSAAATRDTAPNNNKSNTTYTSTLTAEAEMEAVGVTMHPKKKK